MKLIMLAVLVVALLLSPSAAAAPTIETQGDCMYPDGNPDGSWCIWTNPANGLKYFVATRHTDTGPVPSDFGARRGD